MSADTALAVSWIGPSLTPLTNLNSGFRMYEVDSAVGLFLFSQHNHTTDIIVADVRRCRRLHVSFHRTRPLPSLSYHYAFEYSTREAYGGNITWGANDPLNATWWHLVTEREWPQVLLYRFRIGHESRIHAALQKWNIIIG